MPGAQPLPGDPADQWPLHFQCSPQDREQLSSERGWDASLSIYCLPSSSPLAALGPALSQND